VGESPGLASDQAAEPAELDAAGAGAAAGAGFFSVDAGFDSEEPLGASFVP